ncbi:MAG: anti-sigma factor family protein [bacterium]
MNCKKADKYLAAYVDGELRGWWLRRALTKHLEKCVFCQKMVDIQKQIKQLLRSKVKQVSAPNELKLRIRKGLHDELRH